jgi:PsbP-like protein
MPLTRKTISNAAHFGKLNLEVIKSITVENGFYNARHISKVVVTSMLLLTVVLGITSSSYFIIYPKIVYANEDLDPNANEDLDPNANEDLDPNANEDLDATNGSLGCDEDEMEESDEDEIEENRECLPTAAATAPTSANLKVIVDVIGFDGEEFSLKVDGNEPKPQEITVSEYTVSETISLQEGGYEVLNSEDPRHETIENECNGSVDISEASVDISGKNPCSITIESQEVNQIQIDGMAGDDLVVKEGEMVTLKARNPVDSEDMSSIKDISWKPSNPKIQLSNPEDLNPSFEAPAVSQDTTFSFQLTIRGTDGSNEQITAMDDMQVRVEQVSTGIDNPGLGNVVRPGGPQEAHGQIASTQPPAQENSAMEFLTYRNDTEAVKIKYPSHWEILESNNNVTFLSPAESTLDGYQEALRIISIPYTNSPSILADQITSDAKANLPAFRLIDSRPTNINGTSAHTVIYGYRDHLSGSLEQMAIIATKNNTAYIIGYVAEESAYSKYLPIIRTMVNSFEMGPFVTKNPPLLIFSPSVQ